MLTVEIDLAEATVLEEEVSAATAAVPPPIENTATSRREAESFFMACSFDFTNTEGLPPAETQQIQYDA